MRLHYLQHVPFEDLANIEVWARTKGNLSQQSYLKEINKTINLLLDSIEIVQQAT